MKLVAHREIECDLQMACCYYRERDERLPARFLNEYEKAKEWVLSHPLLGRAGKLHIRRSMLNGFPFAIFYQVIEDTIYLGAVMHLSRDERAWLERFE